MFSKSDFSLKLLLQQQFCQKIAIQNDIEIVVDSFTFLIVIILFTI